MFNNIWYLTIKYIVQLDTGFIVLFDDALKISYESSSYTFLSKSDWSSLTSTSKMLSTCLKLSL